jgi:hypothetical protein
MTKGLLGRLSGWQITTIICTGLVVPTTLYAVTFTNVAVINPTTGTPALIDAGGAVHNLDVMGQYANNPLYKVTIEIAMLTGNGCNSLAYTLPAGKALVITSMTGNYYDSGASQETGVEVFSGTSCGGSPYIKHFVHSPGTVGYVTDIAYDYGNGIAIPAGVISVYSDNNIGWTQLHGYLVPANLVPASSFQEAGTADHATGVHGPRAR